MKAQLLFLIFYFLVQSYQSNLESDCLENCVTPFGLHIGTFQRVSAYSNCNNKCINYSGISYLGENELGLQVDTFCGIKWQCVEYARRFFILNKKLRFGDVDSAWEIFDLNTLYDFESNEFEFITFHNKNKELPQIGDLLIYPQAEDYEYGHVAVVSFVDATQHEVGLAEQNEINDKWEDNNLYARKIKYIECDNYYLVIDSRLSKSISCDVSINILGWKRPGKRKIKYDSL